MVMQHRVFLAVGGIGVTFFMAMEFSADWSFSEVDMISVHQIYYSQGTRLL